jgi:O-antigen/teichoic acid export membrane protein
MLGQAGTLLLLRADTVMVEHMRGEAEAGIYGGAIRLSEMAYLLATMVITVLLPKLSERIAHSSPEHARELIRRGNELMVALSLLSSIALCIAGPMAIRWLLGPKYEASIPVLLVHCLSALPYFLSEWRNAVLVAQERATTCAWMAWLALIVNVGLNLLWIPQHGALGAAWATLISYAVGGLLTTWLVPDLRWLAQLQLQALISPFKWLARPRHAWIELQAIIARNAATAA